MPATAAPDATAAAVETTMLICVDPKTNANKFYRVDLAADGTVTTQFGRVGEPGKPGIGGHGRAKYLSIIASKTRKGYKETSVVTNSATAAALPKTAAKKQALADLGAGTTDKRVTTLIERIVAANAHEIRTLSGGKITVQNGQVATPLGLLTLDAVEQAEKILDRLAKAPTDARLLADYLTLVPQSVGRSRDWTSQFFSGTRTVAQQRQFLDQLRTSIEAAEAAAAADDSPKAEKNAKRAFAYTLTAVDDPKVIAEITKQFEASRNDSHVSARMKIVNVYACSSPASEAEFDKVAAKVGNVKRMWHGTRAHNLLSIFATGMQVPDRHGSIHIAGRMFGDGIYFSEQSTKSLNYSRGGIWSSGVDKRCMMFLADVAMGTEYHPNRHGSLPYNSVLDGKAKHPRRGTPFTSINVKAGTCGVRNHEAIVPGPKHVALRYLVEFEER